MIKNLFEVREMVMVIGISGEIFSRVEIDDIRRDNDKHYSNDKPHTGWAYHIHGDPPERWAGESQLRKLPPEEDLDEAFERFIKKLDLKKPELVGMGE